MSKEDGKSDSDPRSIVRETTKWLVTVFGALGAALIAGAPLSGIGNLEAGWRLAVAIGAPLVGLSAIFFGLWRASDVLLPEALQLDALASAGDGELQNVRTSVEANQSLLGSYDKVAKLNADYRKARQDYFTAANEAAEKQAYDEVQALRPIVRDVLTYAIEERALGKLKAARLSLFIAGSIAALAMVVFVWAANPPKRAETPQHLLVTLATSAPAPTATPAPLDQGTPTAVPASASPVPSHSGDAGTTMVAPASPVPSAVE